MRKAGTRTLVTDAEAWGETWRAHQNRYFAEHGIELRVDTTAAHPGEHIGPVRMRKIDSPAVERAEALRTANEAAARDPEQVLAALTRNNATFTERELDRYLAKHLGAGPDGTPHSAQVQDIAAAKAAVLGHKDVLMLHDREDRRGGRAVQHAERCGSRSARRWPTGRQWPGRGTPGRESPTSGSGVGLPHAAGRISVPRSSTRSKVAGLKLIEGRAGTGKSYTLAAVREAHEAAGYRVVGLAPTNAVAQDLKADWLHRSGHGSRGAVRDQERPYELGPADRGGGGRGGDAGQPRDRRGAGGSKACRCQGDPVR